MAEQLVQSVSEEETLDFDAWVLKNGLEDIKHIFTKHNAMTAENLDLTAKTLQSVMTDQELVTKHLDKMPKILVGLKNLSDFSQRYVQPYSRDENAHNYIYTYSKLDKQNDDCSYIVVSEEEDAIIKKIKQNLSNLSDMEKNFATLAPSLKQSTEKLNKMRLDKVIKAKKKMSDTFVEIYKALNEKQNALLDELDKIKNEIKEIEKKDVNLKEMELCAETMTNLEKEKENLVIALKECEDLIKLSKDNETETKQTRKEKMLKIGKNANEKFDAMQIKMDKNKKLIQRMIDENNKYLVEIDFEINDGIYKKMLEKIRAFGTLKNKMINPDEQQQNDLNVAQDPDDEKVEALTKEVAALKKENTAFKNMYGALPNNGDTGIPYKTTVQAGGYVADMLKDDYTKFSYTDTKPNNWIQATFTNEVRIRKIHMASSAQSTGWGTAYLNGGGRQLQYKTAYGNWTNIMSVNGFVDRKNRIIDVNIKAKAIRIYQTNKNWTAIAVWRFYS